LGRCGGVSPIFVATRYICILILAEKRGNIALEFGCKLFRSEKVKIKIASDVVSSNKFWVFSQIKNFP
jgi:hypothetical protein